MSKNKIYISLGVIFVVLVVLFVFINKKPSLPSDDYQKGELLNNNPQQDIQKSDDEEKVTEKITEKPVLDQKTLENIFALDKKVPGTKLYYSKKFGLGFTYLPEVGSTTPVNIVETENSIEVENKSIKVFMKDTSLTLDQTIQKDFLKGYKADECFAVTYDKNTLSVKEGYVYGGISYPKSEEFPLGGGENCPQEYSETNGGRYFMMNKTVPTKYIFLSPGQDSGYMDGSQKPTGWESSIQILE